MNDVSVTSLLNAIIEKADTEQASDIHIDPLDNALSIKFRIDGKLFLHAHFDKTLHTGLIGRIKVLARLRSDEHYTSQDGRFKYQEHNIRLDIRVSIMPTYYGENAVLRLLHEYAPTFTLPDLGLSEHDLPILTAMLQKRNGMIIVTGPTGSGKTTTLYALIKILSQERLVVTIEDPVEYAIPGIRQIQVVAKGLTFAHGLRSILRQDPDVIMVGEIRDTETAQIAIHAALTGHLLLSTMHTSDAASVLPRLFDMGIDPYLIASTVDIVIAQRLVRKVCNACSGKGCSTCLKTGYKKRTGIYEILHATENIKNLILERQSAPVIKKQAIQDGMQTMRADGITKSNLGLTKLEEVESTLA